jgi:hypothetical protein
VVKILKYLITIRFRKLFAKDDFLAIILFVLAIVFFTIMFQIRLKIYVDYLVLFLFQIIVFQIDRKDIDFLKLHKNYKIILILEYVILSLPILILLFLNLKWIYCLCFLFSIFGITFINKSTSKALKYPFKMFDVFWTISFRKYKLFLLIPVFGFVIHMGFKYQNPNLQYAVLLAIAFILCVPSNEREKLHFIKASSFTGKAYLLQQIKVSLYNSIFILAPIALVFLFLKQFQMLLFLPLILVLPIVNLFFKNVFFDRIIVHNIFFAIFIGCLIYGFPLLFIPILYLKSIQNIKIIQNA